MNEFLTQLFGATSLPTFAAGMVLALLGIILQLWYKSGKRDKLSPNTPYKFNFWFMIQDNAQQIAVGLLLSFIAMRFSSELYGQSVTMAFSFGAGFSFNAIAGLLEKLEFKARDKAQ